MGSLFSRALRPLCTAYAQRDIPHVQPRTAALHTTRFNAATFYKDKNSHKGFALKKLAEYLNLDERRTVAVGDYDNDVAMLRAAGCGIAVSNASKAALDASDFVTVSNEEHAIARVIYDIENGKYGI